MPRSRKVLIAGFVVLLACTPLIPRGGDDDEGAIAPSGTEQYAASAAVGRGTLTPALRAEIDRVVEETATAPTLGRPGTKAGLLNAATLQRTVTSLVRCADLDGQRYCLGSGWTDSTEAEVRARTVVAARQVSTRSNRRRETTGDLDAVATLRRTASLSPGARAAAERDELRMAARSVAKVWLLRHEIEGVALPDGFLDRHPEARAETPVAARADAGDSSSQATLAAASTVKTAKDYPERVQILDKHQTAEQQLTYWCGPTAMQMIAWGWKQKDKGQAHWAAKLGTTSSGTAITSMVSVINRNTGWDNKKFAGPYITLDVKNYSYGEWMLLIMRHIADYRAPVVLHPILSKKYYPYLDDDASGHFQAGRGYRQRGKKSDKIGYFEPWNQARFDPSEPQISRVQWRNAYKSYRANQEHFQHNIGV